MAIGVVKKSFIFLIPLVLFVTLSMAFAQLPGVEHRRKAVENAKAMIIHGEKALDLSKKAASAILPEGIDVNSKAMIADANIMIDKTEKFILHTEDAIAARDTTPELREHCKKSVILAREAIHHQKEAIKHADAAIKAHLKMIDAKHHARQGSEHAEDALKKARAANEHAVLFDPGPPLPPPPPPGPPRRRFP